jgi:hypothetical protein
MKRVVSSLVDVVWEMRVKSESEIAVGITRRKERRKIDEVSVCFDGELIKEIQRVRPVKKTKLAYKSDSFQNIGDRILRIRV